MAYNATALALAHWLLLDGRQSNPSIPPLKWADSKFPFSKIVTGEFGQPGAPKCSKAFF